MERCLICRHPKRAAIEADLQQTGYAYSVVACRYVVAKSALTHHATHMYHETGAREGTSPMRPVRDAAMACSPDTDPCAGWCSLAPYARLTRAWREASPRDRERFAMAVQTAEVYDYAE